MITFNNITQVYDNGTIGLNNINLEINDGELVAIIGKSGAGKSTLIRTINKMIDITEGEIIVNDTEVSKLSGRKLREFRYNVGMIFQSFNLITRESAINNVLTAFVPQMNSWNTFWGNYSENQKLKALEALDNVDILDKAFTRVDQLSGGQQQRVALARTNVLEPEIILADEPVASLDPVSSAEVMKYFKKINLENNMTILINIHDVKMALEYCDRVIGIQAGEIIYDGPSSEVTNSVLKEIYGEEYHDAKNNFERTL